MGSGLGVECDCGGSDTMTTARDVIEKCHRDWRGFWPRAFAEDLEKRLNAVGYKLICKDDLTKALREVNLKLALNNDVTSMWQRLDAVEDGA